MNVVLIYDIWDISNELRKLNAGGDHDSSISTGSTNTADMIYNAILCEIIARTIKNMLRQRLRAIHLSQECTYFIMVGL
jgi:hypothetical protein